MNPKVSTSPSPITPTPPVTSPGLSSTPGTSDRVVTENGVAEKALGGDSQTGGSLLSPSPSPGKAVFGHNTTKPGRLPSEVSAGGGSKARAQYKPLKHWNSGESHRDTEERGQ